MDAENILCSLIKKRRDSPDSEKYVLFLGAGASLSSGPSLFSAIIASAGCVDYDAFSLLCDGLSHQERFSLLNDHLAVRSPSRASIMLAEMLRDGYFSLVLTTNFDSLLEHSLHAVGIASTEYQVTINDGETSADAIDSTLLYKEPRIKILKLHGDLLRRRFALTRAETGAFSHAVAEPLQRIFRERDVIIVGSAFADLDLIRTVGKNGGSLWYVNPSPPSGHLLTLLDLRRSREHVVSGETGKFDTFIKRVSKYVIGRERSEYKINWYLLCPFSFDWESRHDATSRYTTVNDDDKLFSVIISQSEEEEVTLTVFPYNVAVLCRKSKIEAPQISEYGHRRRQTYSEILRQKIGLAAIADQLSSTNCPGRWCGHERGVAYCLSMVDVLRPAWNKTEIPNALVLFACPSVMYTDEMGDERVDAIDSVLIDESREDEILFKGCAVDDCDQFSVENNIAGCSSWSGVSIYRERDSAGLDTSSLVEYEITLQAVWWGIHRSKKAVMAGKNVDHPSVRDIAFWRRELACLQHCEATESLLLRRFKESVVKTSRIREEYTELKEMIS